MQIPWTHYRFRRPSTLTEGQFVQARWLPAAFRRQYRAQLFEPLKATLGRLAGMAAVIAIGALWISASEGSPEKVLSIIEQLAITLGAGFVISFALSTLSFSVFSAKYLIYWERVIHVAGRHSDVGLFLKELHRKHLLVEQSLESRARASFGPRFILLFIVLIGAVTVVALMPSR